ncbi:hypothetical protein ABMX64_19710, partial [Vibrio vulnificus]|uniref:hypothetical protein n=2 Tax=Vibrio vulnificus TaxID=672 RepID=UPI004057ECA8
LPSDPAVGQQRHCNSDYLPLSQGDSGFFQPDGFASFAGQTKKEQLSLLLFFMQRILMRFLSLTGGILMIVTNQTQRAWLG